MEDTQTHRLDLPQGVDAVVVLVVGLGVGAR